MSKYIIIDNKNSGSMWLTWSPGEPVSPFSPFIPYPGSPCIRSQQQWVPNNMSQPPSHAAFMVLQSYLRARHPMQPLKKALCNVSVKTTGANNKHELNSCSWFLNVSQILTVAPGDPGTPGGPGGPGGPGCEIIWTWWQLKWQKSGRSRELFVDTFNLSHVDRSLTRLRIMEFWFTRIYE